MATYNQIRRRLNDKLNNEVDKQEKVAQADKQASEKSDAHFLQRAGETVLDLFGNVGVGAVSRVEGIIDFGQGVLGEIGGFFGAEDFKKQMEENIKYDWTGENVLNPLNEITQTSYLNDSGVGQTVESVAQGVGQMLPSVALSLVDPTGTLSKISLYAGASGNSMQEALNEGTSFDESFLYGNLSGGIEVLSEGISDKLFGSNVIDKTQGIKGMFGKSLFKTAKTGLGRMAQTAIGEGIEEAFSEFVNPLLKKIAYDPETKFLDSDHLQRIIDSAVVGGLTSVVYGGTVGQLPIFKNSQKLAQMNDQIVEYNDKVEDLQQKADRGEISAEEYNKAIEELKALKNQLNNNLSQVLAQIKSGDKRSQIINSIPYLKNTFNTDGSIGIDNLLANNQNVAKNGLASAYNKQAVSVNLQVQGLSDNDLVVRDNNNNVIAQVVSDNLNDNVKQTKQFIADLQKTVGTPYNYLFAEFTNSKANGMNYNGKIYLNANADSVDLLKSVVMHEFTHSLEGTQAWYNYAKYVLDAMQNNPVLMQKYNTSAEDLYRTLQRYGRAGVLNSNTNILSEVVADYSGKIFSDASAIKALANQNLTLAQKVLRWIKDTIAKIKGQTAEEREVIKFLRKAESLYSEAIEEAKYVQRLDTNDKKYSIDNQVDNGNNINYNNYKTLEGVSDLDVPIALQDALVRYHEDTTKEKMQKIQQQINSWTRQVPYATNEQDKAKLLEKINRRREDYDRLRQVQERMVDNFYKQGWRNDETTRNFIQAVSGIGENGTYYRGEFFENKEAINLYVTLLNRYKLYKVLNIDGTIVNSVPEEYLLQPFKDIKNENALFGIRTGFYLNGQGGFANANGLFKYGSYKSEANDRLFIKISEYHNIPKTNRHEKIHYIKANNEKIYNEFANNIKLLLTKEDSARLEEKYFKIYKQPYSLSDNEKNSSRVWEEIYAQLYANNETITNQEKLFDIIDDIEFKFKASHNVHKNYDIKYSIAETDSDGNTLSENQREFFNDSKVVDENGKLQVVYHGTTNPGFTIFNGRKAYFTTSNINVAKGYQQNRDYNKIYKGYLNLKNPVIVDANNKRWSSLLKTPVHRALNLSKDQFKSVVKESFGEYNMTSYTPQDIVVITQVANELGYSNYDGLIINNIDDDLDFNKRNTGNDYIFFNSNQFKNINNTNPTISEDIRYSIFADDDDSNDNWDSIQSTTTSTNDAELNTSGRSNLEIKQRAKLNQEKYYNKTELQNFVADALNLAPTVLDTKISPQNRDKIIDALYEKMNTQDKHEQSKVASDIADYLIKHTLVNEIDYSEYSNAVQELKVINKYKGHINLDDGVKSEIKYRYDTERGASIIRAWNNQNARIKTSDPSEVRNILRDEGVILGDSINEPDAFFEILDRYYSDKELIDTYMHPTKILSEALDKSEYEEYKKTLEDLVKKAYDTKGNKSPVQQLKENSNSVISKLKQKYKDTLKYTKATIDFMAIQKKAKDLANRTYKASSLQDETMKAFLDVVSKATNLKSVSANAREQMKKLANVYTADNPKFNSAMNQGNAIVADFASDFDYSLADMIKSLAEGTGALTASELRLYTSVTEGVIHLYKTFDKVYKDGQWQDTISLAEKYQKQLRKNIQVRNGNGKIKLLWKMRQLLDAHSVFRNMDSYDCEFNKDLGILQSKGFFTESYNEITNGEVKANVAELRLLDAFKKFYKEHKGFEKDLTRKQLQLTCNDESGQTATIDVTLGEAISIYLLEARPQANFYKSGITIERKGIITEYKVNEKQFGEFAKQFDNTEKEYIKLVKEFFNSKARNLKVQTDYDLLGYTNIEEGDNYFPINRESGGIAKNLGAEPDISSILKSWSFNKAVMKNAHVPLRINDVHKIVEQHAHGVATYYGLAVPMRNFNRIYNKSIGEDSLRKTTQYNMEHASQYITDLFKDMQGTNSKNGVGSKLLRKLRGSYATYQLGFNLKTVLGQASSYLMGFNYLSQASLAKGLTMKANKELMYKYCPFTEYRMEDKTIVKAQGAVDKISQIGEIATAPIQWMDNNTVKKLWNACQVQIKTNTGYSIGTEENLTRAGQLLEIVVRETQSNSIVSEKTGLARSKNELVASMTMFSSDAQKQLSRIIDGIGTQTTLQWKAKNGQLSKDSMEYKIGKKQIARSLTAFTGATTMYVLIGMMMKWLLNKKKDDQSVIQEFGADFAEQVAGLLPVFRDFYGAVTNGYEVNNYAFSMVSDLASAVSSMWTLTTNLINGKDVSKSEIGAPLRKTVYAIAQTVGIPVRNVYNLVYGVTDKFSPETAYKMNSLFYSVNMKDIDSALGKNQISKAETIIKEVYASKNLHINNEYAKEVTRLYKQGYGVVPSKISQTITYNESEFVLSGTQFKSFTESCQLAIESNNRFIKTNQYANMTDLQREKYLKTNYNLNYLTALAEVVGTENLKSNDYTKYLVLKAMNFDNDVISAMAYIQTIEGKKDKKGNVIANSKKEAIQKYINSLNLRAGAKYILMAYAGYKSTKGEAQVKSYLQSKKFTKEEKNIILKMCGYIS